MKQNIEKFRQKLYGLTAIGLVQTLLAGPADEQFGNPQDPGFCSVEGGTEFIKVPCGFLGKSEGPAGALTFGTVVSTTLSAALLVVGALSVIYLVVGGYRYVTSAGSEERAENAKRTIWHSILGLVLVILSFAIITIITRILITGSP